MADNVRVTGALVAAWALGVWILLGADMVSDWRVATGSVGAGVWIAWKARRLPARLIRGARERIRGAYERRPWFRRTVDCAVVAGFFVLIAVAHAATSIRPWKLIQ